MESIAWFRNIKRTDIPTVGGKGANLGEMANNNFPIPPGFVVTAQAYFKWLEKSGIRSIVERTADSINVEDSNELNAKAAQIRELIESTPMDNELEVEIMKAYSRIGERKLGLSLTSTEDVYVAVRSSATAEDLPEASFAGQQETYLNVIGKKGAAEAVKKCWASLFTARAVYYRRKNNFETAKVGIAVVVQKMVNSEVSGVMFTVKPTGEENELVIEGAYGLGEVVVGGTVTPDRYVVDKGKMKIIEKNIAKQTWMLLRASKGNKKEDVPAKQQEKQKLDDKHVVELAKIGRQIENYYKMPMDIEWALEGNTIYIVQARAITTLGLAKKAKQEINTDGYKVAIKGIAASPGIAIGKAKIILSPEETNKVSQGDILVTKMTSPDWVPIMKRASGIITDEGGSTCFEGKTPILTNKGIIAIEDAYKEIEENGNLFALSLNKETLKPEWKKIVAAMKRNAEVIGISVSQKGTSMRNSLILTPSHKMMNIDNRKIIEEPISGILESGRALCTIDWIPQISDRSEENKKMAYLAGAMFSDGSIQVRRTKGKVQFIQKNTPEKKEFIDGVKDYFMDIFNVQLHESERTYTSTIRGYTFTSTANAYCCSMKAVGEKFLNFREGLQDWVLRADEENIEMFLAGIADGDGSFHYKNGCRLHIYCGKKDVAKAIMLGCLRLGIQATAHENRENCLNIQIVEGLERILKHTKRIKAMPKIREMGTKLFSAKQLLGDIIDKVNKGGRVKPYVEGNLLIDSAKICLNVLPMCSESEGREIKKILDSPLRMKRALNNGYTANSEVFNVEVEDNHNYIVFTKNFTPVWVANCHASIVSRELGIPCVVGTGKATEKIKDTQVVTVDGYSGNIYDGAVKLSAKAKEILKVVIPEEFDALEEAIEEMKEELPADAEEEFEEIEKKYGKKSYKEMSPVEIKGEEESLKSFLRKIAVKVKVNVALPDAAQNAAKTGADGVGLLRAEHMITAAGIHPAEYLRNGEFEKLVSVVKEGIRQVALPFTGKPVWYRTFDARTDEYRNLKGGEKEPKEDNPMLGWHGIRRDLDEPEMLKAQLRAIKELADEGITNVGVMLPFVQHPEEVRQAKEIARQVGLEPNRKTKFGVMVETPAAVWCIDELIKEGIDFISFGTNDLTQLTLGLDRNNEKIQKWFTEKHPAIQREIKYVIKKCRKAKVTTSICGQAASDADMARKMVRLGIDSLSANIDAVESIRSVVLDEEKKIILERKRI